MEHNKKNLRIVKLKEICKIQDGIHTTPKYTKNGIKFISAENINDIYSSNKFISKEDYNNLYKIKAKKNDIFMTRIGNIGIPAIVQKDEDIAYYVTICLFTNISKEVYYKYLYYSILSYNFQKELHSKTLHAAFPKKINLHEIGECLITLPSIKEQKRIAEILTICDDTIENLNQLIEKKELYKKGVMQKLLSGEVRFKGFNDKWRVKKLSEISRSIKTGKLDANAMEKNGKYRFYTCAKEYYRINTYAFDGEALLISGNGAYVGYIHYYKGKFNAYQRTYVLMDFTENIKYIKYYLDLYLKQKIKKERNEGNTPYIVLNTLTNMTIKLPSIEEQNKISELISIIDKQINNLKMLLHLRKQQKKRIMQKLFKNNIF